MNERNIYCGKQKAGFYPGGELSALRKKALVHTLFGALLLVLLGVTHVTPVADTNVWGIALEVIFSLTSAVCFFISYRITKMYRKVRESEGGKL